ncbi:DUF2516 family protein [Actinopolymorpha sp. NPDC004070]|uniref:DUF2516 family protein n=1 Tax=Actinopolymorpha sp. NPDC004070 TaxID=3154548 RepID=UPI0033B40FD8
MYAPTTIVGYLTIALWLILLVMKAFALGDAVMRPAQAFPAVDKQTKPLWLILTGLALLIHLIPQFGSPIGLLNIAGTIAAAVYLVGVRPAVREVGGGRGGRGGGSSGGW